MTALKSANLYNLAGPGLFMVGGNITLDGTKIII